MEMAKLGRSDGGKLVGGLEEEGKRWCFIDGENSLITSGQIRSFNIWPNSGIWETIEKLTNWCITNWMKIFYFSWHTLYITTVNFTSRNTLGKLLSMFSSNSNPSDLLISRLAGNHVDGSPLVNCTMSWCMKWLEYDNYVKLQTWNSKYASCAFGLRFSGILQSFAEFSFISGTSKNPSNNKGTLTVHNIY